MDQTGREVVKIRQFHQWPRQVVLQGIGRQEGIESGHFGIGLIGFGQGLGGNMIGKFIKLLYESAKTRGNGFCKRAAKRMGTACIHQDTHTFLPLTFSVTNVSRVSNPYKKANPAALPIRDNKTTIRSRQIMSPAFSENDLVDVEALGSLSFLDAPAARALEPPKVEVLLSALLSTKLSWSPSS